jgi:hypothetical protein
MFALNTRHSIAKTFRTALLLTGNIRRAEDAVLEAIQNSDNFSLEAAQDSDNFSDDALLRAAIVAAMHKTPVTRQPEDLDSPFLPIELRRVLLLPTELRHCLVLRILASLSRSRCAQLLNLSIAKVDERTCEALRALAQRDQVVATLA